MKFLKTILILILFISFVFFDFQKVLALQAWTQVGEDGFGSADNKYYYDLQEFNGDLYAITLKLAGDSEIWKYDGAAWSQVDLTPLADPATLVAADLEVFDNKLIVDFSSGAGAEVWSFDGATWEQINTDGFGGATSAVYALEVHDSNLYIGTFSALGGRVFRYDGGVNWTQINVNGFGDASNQTIQSLLSLNGNLYAGTNNTVTGAEIWEYDGIAWTQINADGFGVPGADYAYTLCNFNGELYVGTVFGVWHYNGVVWDQVNVDNFGGTHTSTNNLFVYNNKLYAGTLSVDGGGVFEYSGAGVAWTQVNTDGFGDANQDNVLILNSFNNRLYAATGHWENLGGEVWRSFASADLVATFSGDTSVAPGEAVTQTITVANSGPDDAGTVSFAITLPVGSTFQSAAGVGWTCSEAGGVVTCTIDEIANGASSDIVLSFLAPAASGNYNLVTLASFAGILSGDGADTLALVVGVGGGAGSSSSAVEEVELEENSQEEAAVEEVRVLPQTGMAR